jgi:hypothetical protein
LKGNVMVEGSVWDVGGEVIGASGNRVGRGC